MAKILLVTDAWHPQVNGVVTTLHHLVKQARQHGHYIRVIHPALFKIGFPMPGYSEIRLAFPMPWSVRRHLKKKIWDHIHIATPEGPVGQSFSRTCRRLGISFSTSCHTKFPDLVTARYPFVSKKLGWKFMHHVYKDCTQILTTTPATKQDLVDQGFKQRIDTWTRGVDRDIFKPIERDSRDIKTLLCVSRVSHEKGLDDFCSMHLASTRKVVVGDGPYLKTLKKRYPEVSFVGKKLGTELAEYYQQADVFVFPSKADTFGVVNIEAMACGTPVAAYPVTGPIDIIQNGVNGYMDQDLATAVKKCYELDRIKVYESSLIYTWENCYQQFFDILLPAR